MAISCSYCGGSHANPAEVRACWQRTSGGAGAGTSGRGARGQEAQPVRPSTPAEPRRASSPQRAATGPQPRPQRSTARSDSEPHGLAASRSQGTSEGLDELRELGLLPPFPDNDPGDDFGAWGDDGGYVPPGDLDEFPRSTPLGRSTSTSPSPRRSNVATRSAPVDVSGVSWSGRSRAVAGPGPDFLGRNLIVDSVSSAHALINGSPWADARVVTVDQQTLHDLGSVVVELAERAVRRERTVFELRVVFDHEPGDIDDRPLHEIGAHFTFEREQLHHLIWSNSVDGRDPEAPVWALLDAALELGASAAPGGASGDLVLPDGRLAWLDGGPIAITEPSNAVEGRDTVVHRLSVEHRSLSTLGTNEIAGVELAPDQLAAVTHPGGSARIIAPAGSGKTRVLTERARHLLNNWNVPPGAVSLVAFNVRAQNEMRERTSDLPTLQVRTLNAIALAIVNGSAPFAPQPNQRRTIDERDVRSVLDKLVDFPRKRNTDPVAPWIEALSMARLGLRNPHRVEASFNGDVNGFADIFPRYRAALERQGMVDFDEQIYRAIEILLTDADTRHAAQRANRLLLVDEFQDLTPAHLLLVRLLASPELAVFGVGDDDQTIYGYNGADPGSLIDFAALFPGSGDHPLEVNYRCPGGIVTIADRLLRHNRRRVPKTIRAAHAETVGWHVVGGAPGPALAEVSSLDATVDAVAAAIDAGRAAGEIAVLCRVNALLAPVQIGLQVRGIPTSGGVGPEFIERTAVRATLAWLRLASGLWLGADLGEALRRPSRPLHPNVSEWVRETNRPADLERLAGRLRTPRDAERVLAFGDDISSLRDLVNRGATTERVLESLYRKIGLASSVSALDAGRQGTNRGAQDDDLTALAQLASLQPDASQFPSWLAAHFDRSTMPRGASTDGVTLSTVHRVKGQEWPVVVVHEATSTQFPHRLAEDLEEERRLFHVAITRGAAQVVIVGGDDPSPFIDELTTEPSDAPPVNYLRRSAEPDKPTKSTVPGASTLSDKTSIIAVVGLVLSDQGTEWTIESVDEAGAAARSGTTSRRFSIGSKTSTVGGRNGKLRLASGDDPAPSCVRADDALRKVRRLLAAGKPAYTVFDDATIERLALALPTSLEALARIQGIGPVKLERYGDAVLVAIEDALADPTDT